MDIIIGLLVVIIIIVVHFWSYRAGRAKGWEDGGNWVLHELKDYMEEVKEMENK